MHLPAAAYIMTIDASCPPLGLVIVRMSPRIFLFICLTRLCGREPIGLRMRYSRLSLEVADTGPVPVLLLLFGVEEVVSDAPEEGLSIGHRFNK